MLLDMAAVRKLNLIKVLREKAEIDESVRSWFYYSPLWKAIRDHIENNSKHCVLLERSEDPIAIYQGGSINFVRAFLYAMNYDKKPPCEANEFGIDICVTYYEDTLDDDRPVSRLVDYTLNVPISLVHHFTNRDFNAWINKLRQSKNKEKQQKELAQLGKLVKKYPLEAKRSLGK